jgi:hypothetical protein
MIIKRERRRIMQTNPKREQLSASYDWYRQMRETQPVFFDQHVQAWHIFSGLDTQKGVFPFGVSLVSL